MVYTKSLLIFATPGNDDVADLVPLHEFARVKDLSSEETLDTASDNSDRDGYDEDDIAPRSSKKNSNAIQIETVPGGYNSGRIYVIQAKKRQQTRLIIEELSSISKRAQEEANSKSRLRKIQARVASVFNSDAVQRFLAFMIFGVSCITKWISEDCSHLKRNYSFFHWQNFILNIVDTQVSSAAEASSSTNNIFDKLNLFFTLFFTAAVSYTHLTLPTKA